MKTKVVEDIMIMKSEYSRAHIWIDRKVDGIRTSTVYINPTLSTMSRLSNLTYSYKYQMHMLSDCTIVIDNNN
jgi:hypothetical protein